MGTKIIIYRVDGVLHATAESNYNAVVQNARLIYKMDGFDSPGEIIEYYNKYFGSDTNDFIIKE